MSTHITHLVPSGTGNIEGNVYMYIDNSNLWVQGRKTYAERLKASVRAEVGGISSEFVVASGDSDIQTAVATIADTSGRPTSSSTSISNQYLEQIGFQNSKWQGDRRNISPHSAVVLNPEPKAAEIHEFFSRFQHQYSHWCYKMDEIREGAASCDLVIIPATLNSEMDYNARDRFFQTCKEELSKHGLTVLPYQKYAQRFPYFKAKLAISNRFHELPDSVLGDQEDYNPAAVHDNDANNTDDGDGGSYTDVNTKLAKRKEKAKGRDHLAMEV
ncbi:hypothetical protein N657DRAFT_691060 [Parathielavia appendiculata]|uniref:Uncharacterized protein n=1 Tax=Parathielavia appendiculata TaxID=2587402 RepID=A0AAN6Z3C1_9PEZI|nr:hypothetical protein N657DRAFT_691060 [Parathielavia appendiculata]